MAKNTGIRIETVKEVSDTGEIGYRVTSVAALKREDLPIMYLVGNKPDVLLINDHLVVRSAGDAATCVYIDDFYTQEGMDKINTTIAAAGQHLADVNATLKKERAAWSGPVVFVDGVAEPKPLKPSKPSVKLGESVPERIARLWAKGKLYYRDDTGDTWTFKPLKPAE